MGLSREILERQLETATAAQSVYEGTLGDADAKTKKRNPKWRSLDADRRAVKSRLVALTTIEERDAALAAAKAGNGE